MRIINDADSYIYDYKKYRLYFYLLTGRRLLYPEYYEIFLLVTARKRSRRTVGMHDIFAVTALFDEVHIPLCTQLISVDTIRRLEWAHMIGLLDEDELEAAKRLWRRPC